MSTKRLRARDEPCFVARSLRVAIRAGHVIAPHSHPWHQLIYSTAGVMTVAAEQGLWVVPPHWAIWAPAGVRHGIKFTGASTFATLYLRPSAATNRLSASRVITVAPLLRELIVRTCEEGALDRRKAEHRAIALLIVDLLQTQPVPTLGLPMPMSEVLRRVAEYCSDRPSASLGNAAVARRFGLGLRTLERSFESETGMTFGLWRREARFLHGLRLLAQGVPVKRVSTETGYQSPSAFVAAFKARFETTPGRYFADYSGG